MLPVRMLGFLMLIFSLCDADNPCTAVINQLILAPPQIIGEYGGESVNVNCTSTFEEHEGMYWRAGNKSSDTEDEGFFIPHSVSLTDWNVKAQCVIKPDQFLECSKDLEIIVFKNPEVSLSMQLVNAEPEKTQYRLQCDIINVAPVQYLIVKWYKNNETIMKTSFNKTTKTPVSESSILTVNISREENVVQFRCEAQLDFGSQEQEPPVTSQTYNVSAYYAPDLNTNNDVEDMDAHEGSNIILNCKAEGNPPPVFQWRCDGVNKLETTNILSITRINRTITCTCTATNDLGNITRRIHVHVKPRGCPLTLMPSELVVRFGDPALITCNTLDPDVAGMGWEAPVGGTAFEPPPAVNWTVEKVEDWIPSPSCYVTLKDDFQCTVKPIITVYKNPDIVSISSLNHTQVEEGAEHNKHRRTQYRLQCDIINVAPVQFLTVRWYKNNETIMTVSFNRTTKTPVSESSILTVNISREENVVQFRCEAQLDFGSQEQEPPVTSQTYNVSAYYAPDLNTNNDVEDMDAHEGSNIILNCKAEGNPPPVFQWRCDGVNKLETTNILSITRVNRTITCTCTATNDLGNITRRIHVHVKPRGCPLTLMPSELVVRFGDPALITCNTLDPDVAGMGWEAPVGGTAFEPPPAVNWTVEKVEDWIPSPSCYVTLKDDFQCTVKPIITVYKNPDIVSISSLNHTQVEEGAEHNKHRRTQYRLQCDIINVAPVQFLTVRWYKNNETIMTTFFNKTTKTPVSESSILTVNISREENVVQFRCEAQLDFGSQEQEPPVTSQTYNVSAYYAPDLNTNNDVEDMDAHEGSNIILNCEAEGNPPPVFQWRCDGVNKLETTNILSITRVNRTITCTCTATNDLGNITRRIHVHVKPRGCPLTLMPSELVVRFGDPALITCNTLDPDVAGMGWEAPVGGTAFEPPPAVNWTVEKVEDWIPSPSCYVTLKDDFQCTVKPIITVYKSPDMVSLSAADHGPMVEGTKYNLKCDIYNVAPVQKLKVKWYRGRETVHIQTFADSSVTPVNVSSNFIVTPKRDYNGSDFRCEAELHVGPESPPSETSAHYTAIVHYAPDFTEGNDSKEVFFGENVTLTCSAEGNPPSNISWIYTNAVNLKETTVGHQKTVKITKATSANAGVYQCVAENKVGKKTRSVQLMIKGKTSGVPDTVIWVLPILLLLLIVTILLFICHNRQKKHGHYSFVFDKEQNGVDIPLTTPPSNGNA